MKKIRDHGGKYPYPERAWVWAAEPPDWASIRPPFRSGSIIIRSSAATDKGGWTLACVSGVSIVKSLSHWKRQGEGETRDLIQSTLLVSLSPCLLVYLPTLAAAPSTNAANRSSAIARRASAISRW